MIDHTLATTSHHSSFLEGRECRKGKVAAGSTGETGVGPWTQVMAVLIDIASGNAAVVEGTPGKSDGTTRWVAWTEDSKWLLFANGPDLLAHKPGTETDYRVDVELPLHIGMAANDRAVGRSLNAIPRGARVTERVDQARRCNPARVTVTSRRTAALEGRPLAAARACRQ
jgi:hypothetical protein